MAFYEDISKYYDQIFPVSGDTVEFLKESFGDVPKAILDIACGTGGYAVELEKSGYDLTAVDLDNQMIENLREKTRDTGSKLEFLQGDMLKLYDKFAKESFDGVYCIGNSIVHLDNIMEMKEFFINTRKFLVQGGTFVFQIINFDRVISKGVKSLPLIENIYEDVPLKFERFYDHDTERQKILFRTILSVGERVIENEIGLTPLMYDEAIALLEGAGFKEIKAYGDFKRNKFNKDDSFMLIFEAKK